MPLFESAPINRPQPPTRALRVRVRCFSFFAFTSSPHNCKKLWNSDLRVKASPVFPLPVKAKKGISFTRKTHCINELWVKMKGEGRNCELAECAMRRGVSVRAYGGADEETGCDMVGEGTGVFSKKAGRKKRIEGEFRKKVHKFLFDLPSSSKNRNIFLTKPSIVRN